VSSIFGDMSEFGAEPKENKPAAQPKSTAPDSSHTESKNEEYVLVRLDACWADEFDVRHAWVMTREEYEEGVESSKQELEKRGRYTEIYFGTNEAIEVENFDDYMSNLSVEIISKEDYEAFNRMFGGSFGMFGYYFPYGDY
jgi:hypothetical protein